MRWIVLAISFFALGVSPARAGEVAVTFDDLPIFGYYAPMPEAQKITSSLLDGFRHHHWKVTGFVNEIQFDNWDRTARVDLLRRWLDAGMDLGNHSYSHLSLTKTPVEAYITDVSRGETVTKWLLAQRGRQERWYRHPYLETGSPAPVRQAIDGWLAAHGYRVAPVTIDADVWEFAEPYDDAVGHHNVARAQAIRAEYLDYTEAMVGWSQAGAQALFGRQIAFVMMLHDTRLNADCIDDLVAILRRHRLRPVTLERAMRDPAYATREDYAGSDGIEWLERWATALNKPLDWDKFREMPHDIAVDYARVDSDASGGGG